LKASINRAAAVTEAMLAAPVSTSNGDDQSAPVAERKELARQLAALRERVALAEDECEGPPALRAELATLAYFAKTLQADADDWRSALDERLKELERQRTIARQERARVAAERTKLVRRRDALQLTIVQTGARMAQQNGGECRRTLPVFALGNGLTVCSVSVSCPRRGLRVARHWLVTLDDSRDRVLVRRE
jgi:chromosome segregation ATPase